MSRARLERILEAHRFPRVSGDEPNQDGTITIDAKFSPRERG